MAKSQPITYARVAEVLTELGLITSETAQGVIDQFGDLAYGELEPGHEIAGSLEDFGVAVSIHAEDVDFADQHYEWLLGEAAALTGGKVTVDNYRFEKADPDDEDAGRGTMYFERNGKALSFSIEQESNDYLDMGAAQAAIEALSPDDDPRSFRCVDSGPYTLGHDDVMVLATAEQREGLTRHLGITFREPW
ncbi:hypothetical protein [Streptomyces sparsogenes]|uniref:Uncharacterized protein n=1 Tax=Streptomyces sparsogenes DSM 40356 TaxID=1331668 RepID=A0A1R1SFZ7_9ACTN|nr:hypothetical protein [Streptomyces sparsogenes]OMI37304.1 hypothetical protein SPAR_21772 [Streptomyces sparsogenes DSM 40356]